MQNKDHVIGVDLKAFAVERVTTTFQTDVMVLSEEKQCTNVFYDHQVNEILRSPYLICNVRKTCKVY